MISFLGELNFFVFEKFLTAYEKQHLKSHDSQRRRRISSRRLQTRILAQLTSMKQFEDLYSLFTAPREPKPVSKLKRKEFNEFLKERFCIEEDYHVVLDHSFRIIRKYHSLSDLEEKLRLLSQLGMMIDDDIRQSQQRNSGSKRPKNRENVVLELYGYIFQVCLPEVELSSKYIDALLAIRCPTTSWEDNYDEMSKELRDYYLYFLMEDDEAANYERVRNAFDSKFN